MRHSPSKMILVPFLAFTLAASTLMAATSNKAGAPAAKKAVAVSGLKGLGITPDLANLLTDILRSELGATDTFQVMNREDMGEVMKEVKLAAMGACSGKNCLVDVGRALGVSKMVGGSIGKLGGKYVFTVKLVDLNTTKNEIQFTETYSGPEEGLDKVVKDVALRLAGKRKVAAKAQTRAKYPPEGMVLVPADARIITADGRVMALTGPADTKGKAVKAGEVIPPGTVLTTAAKSKARIELANGSLLDLKPQTKVALQTSEASAKGDVSWTKIKVMTGGMLARVKKLTSRKSGFEIQSGEAVCGVRGTIVGAGSDGTFQNFTGDIVVDEGGDSTEVPEGHQYDDGDVDLMDEDDFSQWGDLSSQGVNPGESAEVPGSDDAPAAPPPAEDEGASERDDILGDAADFQAETDSQVFEGALSNGTIEINVDFLEGSSS